VAEEKKFEGKIGENCAGERLDKAITILFPSLSRREGRRLISAGSVYLNGKRCLRLSKFVKKGDFIEILTEKKDKADFDEKIEILFDDFGLIAVNKPPFLPSVPTKTEIFSAQNIVAKIKQLNIKEVHPVTRLDTPVSGLLLFAYQKETIKQIETLKTKNLIQKTYFAWVEGIPNKKEGKIELNISSKNGIAFVDEKGKEAVTFYKTLKTVNGFSLLEIKPITGRMHQIRVHLKEAGFPIVGDRKYGNVPYNSDRPLLHCARISFALEKQIFLEAKVWKDFLSFEEKFRR